MNILHHPHLKIENSPDFYDNLNDPFSFMWLVTISTIFFLCRKASQSKDCHLGKKLFSSPENTAFCSCKIWASCLYPLLFKSSPVWLSQQDTLSGNCTYTVVPIWLTLGMKSWWHHPFQGKVPRLHFLIRCLGFPTVRWPSVDRLLRRNVKWCDSGPIFHSWGQQWHGSKLNDSSCPIQNKMVSWYVHSWS